MEKKCLIQFDYCEVYFQRLVLYSIFILLVFIDYFCRLIYFYLMFLQCQHGHVIEICEFRTRKINVFSNNKAWQEVSLVQPTSVSSNHTRAMAGDKNILINCPVVHKIIDFHLVWQPSIQGGAVCCVQGQRYYWLAG